LRLCAGCVYQCSLTAGTIMHNTKLPLRTWFLAMHLTSSAKNDVAPLELRRQCSSRLLASHRTQALLESGVS
jgi:hypothetical protein